LQKKNLKKKKKRASGKESFKFRKEASSKLTPTEKILPRGRKKGVQKDLNETRKFPTSGVTKKCNRNDKEKSNQFSRKKTAGKLVLVEHGFLRGSILNLWGGGRAGGEGLLEGSQGNWRFHSPSDTTTGKRKRKKKKRRQRESKKGMSGKEGTLGRVPAVGLVRFSLTTEKYPDSKKKPPGP